MIQKEHIDELQVKAFRLTGDRENAGDLVQDTLYRALDNWAKYKAEFSLSGWLYRIMFNLFMNAQRRKQVVNRYLWESGVDRANFQDPQALLSACELKQVVQELQDLHRQPLQMSIDGYAYDEIAEHLRIPIGTVKSRLHHARKVVRTKLNGLKPTLTSNL